MHVPGFGVLVPSSPVGMALMIMASFVLCPVFFALLTEIVAVHLTIIKWLSFVITDYHQNDLVTSPKVRLSFNKETDLHSELHVFQKEKRKRLKGFCGLGNYVHTFT